MPPQTLVVVPLSLLTEAASGCLVFEKGFVLCSVGIICYDGILSQKKRKLVIISILTLVCRQRDKISTAVLLPLGPMNQKEKISK